LAFDDSQADAVESCFSPKPAAAILAYHPDSCFGLNYPDVFWQVASGYSRRFDLFCLRDTYNYILRQGIATEEVCLCGCQRTFNGCFLYKVDEFSA
jgi:hypothetical protein